MSIFELTLVDEVILKIIAVLGIAIILVMFFGLTAILIGCITRGKKYGKNLKEIKVSKKEDKEEV